MRLICVDSLLRFRASDFRGDSRPIYREFSEGSVPPYAIASHRWTDEELVYRDMTKPVNQDYKGWQKLVAFCVAVRKLEVSPPIDYLWIDTCCIDKANLTELSEALNSMFRWYSEAAVCLAFLHDVPGPQESTPRDLLHAFGASEWFKRGWTLQELLAPKRVVFYSQTWKAIGHKFSRHSENLKIMVDKIGLPMNHWIERSTGIPENVLWDVSRAEKLTFEERQGWMRNRQTTRVEDMAYCQLGLYGVFLSPIYGEREQAYDRLLDEIERKRQRELRRAKGPSPLPAPYTRPRPVSYVDPREVISDPYANLRGPLWNSLKSRDPTLGDAEVASLVEQYQLDDEYRLAWEQKSRANRNSNYAAQNNSDPHTRTSFTPAFVSDRQSRENQSTSSFGRALESMEKDDRYTDARRSSSADSMRASSGAITGLWLGRPS